MTTAEYADALRRIAAYYEAHPEVPSGEIPSVYAGHGETGKIAMVAVARSWPRAKKEYTRSGLFYLTIDLGGKAMLQFYTGRESVCRKEVLGTRVIPGKHVEAVEEHDEPDSEEEVIQWVCEPLLQEEV